MTELSDLHARCKSLNMFWRVYANPEQKQRYETAFSVSLIEATSTTIEGLKQNPEPNLKRALDRLSENLTPIQSARLEIRDELQKQTKQDLISGRLVGLGYEAPRRLEAKVHQVPKHFWQGQIMWDNNWLIFESLKLIDIHVLSTEQLNNHLNPTKPERISVGRPSLEQDIKAAIEALDVQGKIDASLSAKSHYPMIKDQIEANGAEQGRTEKLPSEQAIKKYFNPFFNARKTKL